MLLVAVTRVCGGLKNVIRLDVSDPLDTVTAFGVSVLPGTAHAGTLVGAGSGPSTFVKQMSFSQEFPVNE
jgi:hypothetical protein